MKKYDIKSALICGKFKEGDLKFSWPLNFIVKNILKFDYILVQDQESKKVIENLGHKNTFICGDTRFDRVMDTADQNDSINYINEFKANNKCIVAGSIWEGDQSIIVDYINSCKKNIKFILAPHEIDKNKINSLRKSINQKSILHSELSDDNKKSDVLIIDNVGMLARLYKYADIAYVGGGMGNSGLHNTLEPAAFGVPIIIGKNYSKFLEAETMIELGGMVSIKNDKEFSNVLDSLLSNELKTKKVGQINYNYILKNTGATKKIMNYL